MVKNQDNPEEEPLATPLDSPQIYNVFCPDCNTIDFLWFNRLEFYQDNYILVFTCDVCHTTFSVRLKTGYIKYDLRTNKWEVFSKT